MKPPSDPFSSGPGPRAFDELKLADRLPSVPGLCLALLGLTHEGKESKEDLVERIRADPALTGRLLQLANSSRPAGTGPLTTARAAAAALGLEDVRRVALSFYIPTNDPSEVCQGFDHRRFWLLSLACGSAAESLARRFRLGDPEEAFTLGLLLHAGQLAMATVHPGEFAQVLRECQGKDPDHMILAEVRALRIHHWQVAADLMADWGLPKAFHAPVLSLSRSALDPPEDEAETARTTPLITLALEMGESLVAEHFGSPARSPVVSAAAAGNPARGGEARAFEELSPAREEARRRWRDLVQRCGLDDGARETPGPVGNTATIPSAASTSETTTSATAETPTTGLTTVSAAALSIPSAEPAPVASRVLVVDDDPGARHLIGLHLRRAGCEVISASDGESGLRMAVSEAPQIVITDWLMPGLSGLDLCRALRRTEAGRKIYIILLTSREEEESIVEGLEGGANDYVTKPFNPRILVARVHAGQRVVELQRRIETDKQIDKRRVAQMAQLTRKLRSVALIDPLTGLQNRRFAMNHLEEAWSSSVRCNRPLAVVMIDIDHFKKVNDRHGHRAGDAVLRATADVLRSKVRRSEVICRLGGEEFLLVCSNSSLEQGLVCAERLRTAVESNRITVPDFEGAITVSLGVAERVASMGSIDDLVNAADQAVYEAKAQGRNRVCVHMPESEPKAQSA